MDMKGHILAAMREIFERWDGLLSGLDESRLPTPETPDGWSIKDILAHLMAWQQRSIARLEGALADREEKLLAWLET